MSRFLVMVLWAILAFAELSMAQKPSELAEKGSEAMKVNDYFSAAQYFREALSKDSSDYSWWYDYAESSRLSQDYKSAERAYKKVSDKDNGKNHPWALFYLGETKKIQGKYKEAQKLFEKSQRRFQKKYPPIGLASKRGIEDCIFSLQAIKNPVDIQITRADSFVNSTGSDLSPFMVKDDLFFSSYDVSSGKNKLFYHKSGLAEKAKLLKSDSAYHFSSLVFLNNGPGVICSACTTEGAKLKCKIAEAELVDNLELKGLKFLSEQVNAKNFNQTHPSIGILDEKEILFFTSDRDGGLGGMDIWYCIRKPDGNWGPAVNAGPEVNTDQDEISPFICSPCHLLFFSSNGRVGFGGFDIYRCQIKDMKFEGTENMGYPMNSGYHELNFSLSQDQKNQAWFSSNRPDEKKPVSETCCNDLFKAEFPKRYAIDSLPLKADTVKILANSIRTLIPLSLYFNNDEPDKKTMSITTQKNYKKTCEDYLKEKDRYLKEYSKGLNEDKKEKALTEMDDFFEDSVRYGLKQLESFTTLMHQILERGGEVSITMKGYCSPLASTDYNINLAKRRIVSLKNYFSEWNQGILASYLNKGLLKITEEEIGELKASALVSDNPNEQAKSVYSLSAALERKIEIIAVGAERISP